MKRTGLLLFMLFQAACGDDGADNSFPLHKCGDAEITTANCVEIPGGDENALLAATNSLSADTTLVLGNSAQVTAPTTLCLSAAFTPTPTGWGGTLYAAPILLAVPLTLPPAGLAVPFTVTCDSSLWGSTVYLQQLLADAGAPQGVAFSRCLAVTLGGF